MRRGCRFVLAAFFGLAGLAASASAQNGPMPGGPPPGEYFAAPSSPFTPAMGSAPMAGPPGGQAYGQAYGAPAPPLAGQGGYDPYCDPNEAPWYGAADEQAPVDSSLLKERWFDGGYLRGEYLNWNIKKPGDILLGAPILNNFNARVPFPVTDPGSAVAIGTAIVPSTKAFDLRGNNGVRATWGTELMYGGTIEVSAFALAQASSGIQYDATGLRGINHFIATSTFVSGQPANNLELYNQFYSATYQSHLWGGEGNYYFDGDRDGFVTLRPLVGVRYVSLQERLDQRGVFRDFTFAVPSDTVSDINSVTWNNLAGPQLGFRSELQTKFLSAGVEPKVGFMTNNALAKVRTNHFRSNLDPEVITKDHFTMFSPLFEVSAYGRVHLSPNFAVRIGYNFLFLGRVTRPEDNIYYNDNGPYFPPVSFNKPDVVVSATRHDIWIQGITLGCEYKW